MDGTDSGLDVDPTLYAPGGGGTVEGEWKTSKPNLENQFLPHTLDDVRQGKSPYVTLASNVKNYGTMLEIGPITYNSPLDQQIYTGDPVSAKKHGFIYSENLKNVVGYVHDTGGKFKHNLKKFDIALGKFTKWSTDKAADFVDAQQPNLVSGTHWRVLGEDEATKIKTEALAVKPPSTIHSLRVHHHHSEHHGAHHHKEHHQKHKEKKHQHASAPSSAPDH